MRVVFHDADRLTLRSIAQAALARLPQMARLEVVRGNGYYYVVGDMKAKGKDGQPIPITSGGIYTNRLGGLNPEFGLDWWVRQVVEVVKADMPSRFRDAKWKGTYSARLKTGKQVSLEMTVQAPDAYQAGDKLKAEAERRFGKDLFYPVIRFAEGPKRLETGSMSERVAAHAGAEEE